MEKRSPVLTRLLAKHNLQEPKSVDFAPIRDSDFKRCFVNVERQVERGGGRIETGWLFWEVEDTSIYTEAHAVWITPQGKRRDITPQRLPPERRILFLPDPDVAARRGVTPPYVTILSDDERVIALERFHQRMGQIVDSVFPGFGIPYELPVDAIQDAAMQVGLPRDVADYFIAQKIAGDRESAERFVV